MSCSYLFNSALALAPIAQLLLCDSLPTPKQPWKQGILLKTRWSQRGVILYTAEQTTENHISDLCETPLPPNVTFIPCQKLPSSSLSNLFLSPTRFSLLFFPFIPQDPKSNIPLIFSHRRMHLSFPAWTSPDTYASRVLQLQHITRFFSMQRLI